MATNVLKTNGKEADEALSEMSAQIESLKNDIAGLTSAMGDYGKAQSRILGAKASNAADTVRERSKTEAERLALQAQELQEQANDFVARQPGTALGIAAGVGFLVGMWSSRR